jgi:hypothetical protein
MDKYFSFEVVVMDGPEPCEQRAIVAVVNRFSCPLEYHLHNLNRYLLLCQRLGWPVSA